MKEGIGCICIGGVGFESNCVTIFSFSPGFFGTVIVLIVSSISV